MGESVDVLPLEPGTLILDKYRIVEVIGSGGMGVVVAADHLQLGSRIAIKFLLPSLVSNDAVVRRFIQEARAATRIQSEHVTRVIDVGTLTGPGYSEAGIPFMVMEYLEGQDLSEWVRSGHRFEVDEAIEIIVQAAEALAQAHKVGVIHRDVKPANLFLNERDGLRKVKVLDFGISKIRDEEPQEMSLTKTTTVLGSGLYMSPEQMRSAKKVDHRTDIYALGVCLYELLTGTQPFTAETFSELCVKVNMDPPTPLREYRPDVGDDFAAVVAKAYAREPAERYQTVGEFCAALAPFAAPISQRMIDEMSHLPAPRPRLDSLPRSLPPPPLSATAAAVTATAQPGARSRSTVAALLGVAALVAAVGGGLMWSRSGLVASPPEGGTVGSSLPPIASPTPSLAVEPPLPSASAQLELDAGAPDAATDAPDAAPSAVRTPRLPPPRGTGTVVVRPPPSNCVRGFKTDPASGLKVPCN